jgi:predicted metalloprotease with PDZ domain
LFFKKNTSLAMLRFFRVLLWLGCLAGSPMATQARSVQYTIEPVWAGPERLADLRITLRVVGDADGSTTFQVPNVYGGATDLYRCVRHLRATERGQVLRYDADSTQVVVQHPPGREVRLTYQLRQDFLGEWPSTEQAFRPIIQPSFFHVLGATLFVVPSSTDGYAVSVEWVGFPAKWLIHNSFGADERRQTWQADDLVWFESVFVGGTDWRRHTVYIRERPVHLVLRGTDWDFSDTSLLRLLEQTVECQRQFWADYDIGYYTVTLLPLAVPPQPAGTGGFSYAYLGTGLRQSFAAFATPVRGMTAASLQHMLHHELMHHWIGGQIRNGGPPNDMTLAWLSEGFTEYFAYKNRLRCGAMSPEAYAEEVNERFFRGLWTSPQRTAPNSAIARDFFTNPELGLLPYTRGFVLAWYLDRTIAAKSNGRESLDDVMRACLAHYRGAADVDLTTDFDFFLKKISAAAGINSRVWHQQYVVEGQFLSAHLLGVPDGFILTVDADGFPSLSVKK